GRSRSAGTMTGRGGSTMKISEIMAASGLTAKVVSEALGRTGVAGADEQATITKELVADLTARAGKSGAGSALTAGGEAMKEENAKKEQMTLMRTMTEALIAIAKKHGDGFGEGRGAQDYKKLEEGRTQVP